MTALAETVWRRTGLRQTNRKPVPGGLGPEPARPAAPRPRPDAECGRGLTVVAALSHRWGCDRTAYHRKVVWSELIVPERLD
jgi:hypothetical protein